MPSSFVLFSYVCIYVCVLAVDNNIKFYTHLTVVIKTIILIMNEQFLSFSLLHTYCIYIATHLLVSVFMDIYADRKKKHLSFIIDALVIIQLQQFKWKLLENRIPEWCQGKWNRIETESISVYILPAAKMVLQKKENKKNVWKSLQKKSWWECLKRENVCCKQIKILHYIGKLIYFWLEFILLRKIKVNKNWHCSKGINVHNNYR